MNALETQLEPIVEKIVRDVLGEMGVEIRRVARNGPNLGQSSVEVVFIRQHDGQHADGLRRVARIFGTVLQVPWCTMLPKSCSFGIVVVGEHVGKEAALAQTTVFCCGMWHRHLRVRRAASCPSKILNLTARLEVQRTPVPILHTQP